MSVAVSAGGVARLQQDIGESPSDTMPDVSLPFSFLLWVNNLAPAIGGSDYKVALSLFTTADLENPSYSDPYARITYRLVDGSQAIGFTVGTGAGESTPFVTSGLEKRAFMVTYDPTLSRWLFAIRRLAAWEIVGTKERSFSGTPITQMRMLNDGLGSIGSISGAYFRLYNGRLLTLEQAEQDMNSGVALVAGVTTDTPLIALTDLTDVSGNGNQWYAKP